MSQAQAGTSGLVRVTVASGTRRVDLVVPGAVPVAELVPELARTVGLLDGATVYGGYHLLSHDGRELSNDAGLIAQGIEDGGLLTVTAGIDDEVPRVYDDIVEAMTDVVERDLRPWQPSAGRRTALWAAALLLALGAAALLRGGGSLGATAAAVVATALVVGAVVLSRSQGEHETGVAVGWMGAGYAAVAGLLAGSGEPLLGLPVALAGLGALVAGLACLVGLLEGRPLAIPPVVVGAIALATGLVMRVASFDPAVVLTTALVVLVIAGSVFPWLALSTTGTTPEQIYSDADITADPDDIDPHEVGADARLAHEILVAVSATVGLLLVLVAPLAVGLGVYGAVLAVLCCAVVMLRTRQYRTGTQVLVGLVSGIAGLAVVAVSALLLHPAWQPVLAVVLATAGALLIAATLVPDTPSVRRGRAGDVLETLALLSLLPLLVLATGLFDSVLG